MDHIDFPLFARGLVGPLPQPEDVYRLDTTVPDAFTEWLQSSRFGPGPAAASADGSVFIGSGPQGGYVWSGGADAGLPFVPTDVSADGTTIVGWFGSHARVRRGGTNTVLAPPADFAQCSAIAVSNDGRAIAGVCATGGAVLWQDGVGSALGPEPWTPRGISGDGSTVVGERWSGARLEAVRWRDGALATLGAAPEADFVAIGASVDGSVVVGREQRDPEPPHFFTPPSDTWRWDETHGRRRVYDVLVERGISESSVSTVANPVGITDDGYTIAGHHWVAYLAPDADNDRTLDADDLFPNDPTEWSDRDGDGVGDNGDPFPDDPTETEDTDRDGIGDLGDPFPEDPTRPVRATVSPGDLLLAAGAHGLIRIDPASGDVGWVAYGAGLVANDVIAAPSGAIYVADRTNERIVRVDADGAVTIVADGLVGLLGLDAKERLLVSNPDGVFRVDPATGRSRSLEVGYAVSVHTDAFGDTFGYQVGDFFRIDLDAANAKRHAAGPQRHARSVVGQIIIVTPGPDPPVDIAIASHREVLWIEPTIGVPLRLRRSDMIAHQGGSLEPTLPPSAFGFDAASLAVSPAGELYLSGRLLPMAGAASVVVAAFSRAGAFDRVLFSEDRLPEPMGAHGGWSLAIVPGADPPQAVDCSDALAPTLAAAIAADAKAALRCMDAHARGKESAAVCVSDALDAASAPERRAAAAERVRCFPGAAGAKTVGDAARGAVEAVLDGLFGDLDAALVARTAAADAAACQKATAAAASRCVRARIASFERCRAPVRAADGPLLDGAAFAECFAASERTCDATRIAPRLRRCAAVDVAAAFPACEAADASGLALCAAAQVECAACRALEAVHGVQDACAEACPAAP